MRPIYKIAKDIKQDWNNPYFGALPYLNAMQTLDNVNDWYHYDTARTIILYFLGNAQSWRGKVAKEIKAELKELIK
jgi:hypothetical protein